MTTTVESHAVDSEISQTGYEGPLLDFERVKVIVVDDEARPSTVTDVHDDGGKYGSLWMLVRREKRPLGLAKIPFLGRSLTSEDIDPVIEGVIAAAHDQKPVSVSDSAPLLSIVVPTILKRDTELRGCVDALSALDYPAIEVVIVDNRPEAGPTPEWLLRNPSVRVVIERTPGISAARNKGILESNGSIVAFTDDDVVVDPGWARALVSRLEDGTGQVAVTGLVLPHELETRAQLLLEEYYGGFGPRVFQPVSHRLRRPRTSGTPWRLPTAIEVDEAGNELKEFSIYAAGTFGPGANMAFRREALLSMGGFDTRLGIGTPTHGGEDLAMFVRLVWAGHSIGFEPAALVHHTHRRDDESLRRQIEGYGTGFAAMMLALMSDDPRHLVAVAATVPRAVRSFSKTMFSKVATRERTGLNQMEDNRVGSTVSELAKLEMLGMAKGPAAFFRSRRIEPA